MNPFLSGAAIGWLLYKLNGKSISFTGLQVVVYWCVATVLFAITIFMTYKRDILPILCATILSVGKYIFGLFIGSLIVMSHLGYGGKFPISNFNREKCTLFLLPYRWLFAVDGTPNDGAYGQINVHHVYGQSDGGDGFLWTERSQHAFR